MTVDLSTSTAGLVLKNPVLTASGCAGTGPELAPFLDLTEVGAFVTPSISLDPREGDPAPRVAGAVSGLLHSWETPGSGISGFLSTELPWLARRGVVTVASVTGSSLQQYGELARRLSATPGVSGVEVDLAARNIESGGRMFGADPYHAAKATAAVRRDTTAGRPVLAKLIPDVHHLVDVARAVVDAGADGVVLIDGPRGMAIDPVTLRPSLGTGTGRLCGPAVRPLVVRCVWEVRQALPAVPIVAVGGIHSGAHAFEMLLAGADAVQVGSATLSEPSAPARVVRELAEELRRRGIDRVGDVVGRAHDLEGATP